MSKSKYGIIDVVKDALTGDLKVASDSTVDERLAICNDCEVQNALKICTACGCFIPAKVKLAESECPMELWSKEQ